MDEHGRNHRSMLGFHVSWRESMSTMCFGYGLPILRWMGSDPSKNMQIDGSRDVEAIKTVSTIEREQLEVDFAKKCLLEMIDKGPALSRPFLPRRAPERKTATAPTGPAYRWEMVLETFGFGMLWPISP